MAAAAPESMSEKAIAIGLYAVASGIFTVFMPLPHVAGSRVVRQYLEQDVERDTGGRFLFTNDVEEAARGIVETSTASARRSSSRRCSTARARPPGAVAPRTVASYEQPRGVVAARLRPRPEPKPGPSAGGVSMRPTPLRRGPLPRLPQLRDRLRSRPLANG